MLRALHAKMIAAGWDVPAQQLEEMASLLVERALHPCMRTAPHLPAGRFSRLDALLLTPKRRRSSLEARGG